MARSMEQWKAQQKQATHTQPHTNSFFQLKRPGPVPSDARPTAIFQLGKPATGAPLKSDTIQTPRQSGCTSGHVIDLTLDDDEEEDEPMGTQPVPTSSAASDALKLSLLNGTWKEAAGAAQTLQQSDSELQQTGSELLVPLAEDVESDVDEEWPTVPPSAVPTPQEPPTEALSVTPTMPSSPRGDPSHGQTTEEVGAALDAIRLTIPFSQDTQQDQNLVPNAGGENDGHSEQTHDEAGEMEGDVDEELPNQVAKTGSGSKPPDRIVRVEHLEDGEIFEEGAAPKSSIQAQRGILMERQPGQFDVMGIRPNLRNKKQKKRGKKKAKRKLDAMQMTYCAPGEVPTEFERVTRQRPFAEAPSPGQYTLAMMRNCPRGDPMNVRPVFQDPPPAPFRPVGLLVSGQHPPMRPSPPQLPALPLPPLPYEDSQILRVNRQGSMEMLGGETESHRHQIFSEPARYGEFKYRSVSMPPPRPTSAGPSHTLQRAVSSDQSHPPPPPPSGPADPVASMKAVASDAFDLDSLRAAALRSKVKRPAKTLESTTQQVHVPQSSLSVPSSPRPAAGEQRASEHTSPEIDSLRLEILRSMTRNRKRGATKAPSISPSLTPPADGEKTITKRDQNASLGIDTSTRGDPTIAQTGTSAPSKLPETVQAHTDDIGSTERAVNDGISCETDKSTTASEQNESGDKMDSPSAPTLESPKRSGRVVATTSEFRPLTACSQSLVIRLSPEDFLPQKGGNSTHATSTESNTPSSYRDAITNLRRKIAEREKKQTTLLESAAAKLSKQSSGSGSSSCAASSSSSPNQLSPGRKTSDTAAKSPGAIATPPNVNSSATIAVEKSVSRPVAIRIEGRGSTHGVNSNAEVIEEEKVAEASTHGMRLPAETTTGTSAPAELPREPALESQEQSDTSRGNSTLKTTDGVPATKSCHVIEQPTASGASNSGSGKGELDFDAIRVEYEQCMANCEQAEIHIARLSSEMAQLEKLLPQVGSTVEGA